jgi:hypothetical protein
VPTQNKDPAGWSRLYHVHIVRTNGRDESFAEVEGHKVAELVHLCISFDDPNAHIQIKPVQTNVIH